MLIALLDRGHIHHALVTNWLANNIDEGWASSPITQNGCVRILSQPNYPNTIPAAQVAERLVEATQHSSHAFWPDSISLLHPGCLKWDKGLSSKHVTNVYLLSLAVQQGGCFVTLDREVPVDAVVGASPEHLVMLS